MRFAEINVNKYRPSQSVCNPAMDFWSNGLSYPIAVVFKNGKRVDGPWSTFGPVEAWQAMITANGGTTTTTTKATTTGPCIYDQNKYNPLTAADDMQFANPQNNLNCWLKSTLFQANEQCAGSYTWRQNQGMDRQNLLNTLGLSTGGCIPGYACKLNCGLSCGLSHLPKKKDE